MASSGILNTTGYQGRYLQFSWTIKNSEQDRIETNQTTIAWTLKGAGDAVSAYYETGNITLTIDGVTAYTRAKFDRIKLYGGTQVASGEITFTHDSNGKKSFDVSLKAGIYLADVNCTGSDTFVVDDIPRASTLVAYNGQLAQPHTLTIVPASPTFKHRLTYNCGEVSGYIAGSTTEYYTGDPAVKWAPPIGLAAQNTSGTKVLVRYTLYTYTSSGTHVGTVTETVTCAIPPSVAPSCTISYGNDPSGALGVYGKPVQGVSKLKLTVDPQTSQGAGIESCTITAAGVKYTPELSGDDYVVTTGLLTNAGAIDLIGTVVDSRGRSGTAKVTVDVLAYSPPVISALSVRRGSLNSGGAFVADNQGEYFQLTFSATVTDLVTTTGTHRNAPTYTVEYKKSTDTSWTQIAPGLSNVYNVVDKAYTLAADSNSTYDVRVTVVDSIAQDVRATSLSTAFTMMNWNAAGNGMGIGKVSEKEYTLEVGIASDFSGDVYGQVYGLGGLPAIPSGADLNDYLTPGIYAARTTEIAQSLKNCPSLIAGRLIVSSSLGQPVTGESEYRYIEQKFIPYTYAAPGIDRPTYLRYIVQEGAENVNYLAWFNEALKAYPVGSIHIRYDTLKPDDIFGGTWVRISNYLLRGVAEGGTIGETVGLADGSSRTAVNVAIWRRKG